MREGGGETKAKKGNRLGRTTLLSAIRSDLKAASGRDDLKYDAAPEIASRTAHDVPIEERAGYPIVLAEGSVQPKDWVTAQGVKIMVDFSRPAWMPDDWGQGVKTTQRISRSVKGSGGTLTSFVSPDGKVFYHKKSCERYAGRKFAANEGFQGQVRRARLQSQQAIQLARLQIRNASASAPAPEVVDEDASFFQLLSAEERRSLPDISEFHFAVVSARRAAKIEGVRDIWMVQSQFLEGVPRRHGTSTRQACKTTLRLVSELWLGGSSRRLGTRRWMTRRRKARCACNAPTISLPGSTERASVPLCEQTTP